MACGLRKAGVFTLLVRHRRAEICMAARQGLAEVAQVAVPSAPASALVDFSRRAATPAVVL